MSRQVEIYERIDMTLPSASPLVAQADMVGLQTLQCLGPVAILFMNFGSRQPSATLTAEQCRKLAKYLQKAANSCDEIAKLK